MYCNGCIFLIFIWLNGFLGIKLLLIKYLTALYFYLILILYSSFHEQLIGKVRNTLISILLNTLIYILRSVNRFKEDFKYQKEFEVFSTYLESFIISETNLKEIIQLTVLNGAKKIRTGETNQGIKEMKQAIDLLRKLGAKAEAASNEQYLQQII